MTFIYEYITLFKSIVNFFNDESLAFFIILISKDEK